MADIAEKLEDIVEYDTEKLLGVGLGKALSLAIFTIIVIVMLKVIFTRYPVTGLSEFINAV